jgi:hypothetical protein
MPVDTKVESTLVRVNARAWGIASGLLFGGALFFATNILVLKGGEDVGQHLGHLGSVFPGYDVTPLGSVVGFVYAFVVGYALGRLLAPRRPLERGQVGLHKHVRLNGRAWGLTLGGLLAVALLVGTNWLLLRGGEHVGSLLSNLSIYLPGFRVSFVGSLIGAAWLFAIGWLVGNAIGGIYNLTVERAEV